MQQLHNMTELKLTEDVLHSLIDPRIFKTLLDRLSQGSTEALTEGRLTISYY